MLRSATGRGPCASGMRSVVTDTTTIGVFDASSFLLDAAVLSSAATAGRGTRQTRATAAAAVQNFMTSPHGRTHTATQRRANPMPPLPGRQEAITLLLTTQSFSLNAC